MNKDYLVAAFKKAKEEMAMICVEIKMPGQKSNEYIINDYSALDNKLEYYMKAYDDNLVHVMNSEIKIVDVYPVRVMMRKVV